MTTLPNSGMQLPIRGAPGSGTWDDTIDANYQILDVHDHTVGKFPRVPTAGLNINADLPFSALYAPTQFHRVQFSTIAGAALTNANNLSLFVSDGTGGLAANELYYRTSAGNNVRIINGSSLNVSAFVGGIGGDYQSVGAQLNYDDAGKRYTFKEGTGDSNGWARLAAGSLRLIEFNTTESVYVGQSAPAALAASYDMTWPTALPAATGLVQIDNTGQISVASGNALPANQSITVSGTGLYKHGTQTLLLPLKGILSGASPSAVAITAGATDPACVPFVLPVGARILRTRAIITDNVTGPTTLKVGLMTWDGNTASASNFGTVSAGTGALQTVQSAAMTVTTVTGSDYYVEVTVNAGAAACSIKSIEVDYDQP